MQELSTRGMCTENAKCEKTVLRHVWQDYVEMAEHVRHMWSSVGWKKGKATDLWTWTTSATT